LTGLRKKDAFMSADPEQEPPPDPRAELAAKGDSGEPYTLSDLLAIMAVLRTPVIGCPWDLEQNFATIAPYTIEEAYEVADAIARGDLADLKDELGDLLLQVVFHAQMAEEERVFDFADVADAISRKLIRRHPHVFGDESARSAAQVPGLWDRIKAEEAAAKAKSADLAGTPAKPPSVLDGVPLALPALTRSVKIQRKASKVGFDWTNTGHIFWKVKEEMAELEAEIATGDWASLEDEFGDVLFVLANLARRLEIDPEQAMNRANAKFIRRFSHIERSLTESGRGFGEDVTLEDMEALWNEAKALERQRKP
jgi:nucleoside triphosphate diphosphatase